jgi:hypothetical protein
MVGQSVRQSIRQSVVCQAATLGLCVVEARGILCAYIPVAPRSEGGAQPVPFFLDPASQPEQQSSSSEADGQADGSADVYVRCTASIPERPFGASACRVCARVRV